MVVAKQVKRTVDNQVRRVLLDADSFLGSLSLADAMRQDEVAQHDRRAIFIRLFELVLLRHREGEDIGGLVLAPPLGVQDANLVVASETDGQLDMAAGRPQLREGAFSDCGLGGLADTRLPSSTRRRTPRLCR